jgi:hypothetical protein
MNTIQTQNLWERYGFRDNPFDTRALSVSPEAALPVSAAYIHRQSSDIEHRLMTNFLRNPGGGCVFVEGGVGVGKTTFVNYYRYTFQVESRLLMTPPSEMSVQPNWNTRDFLLSALGSLGGRLAADMNKKALENDDLLNKVAAMTSVLLKEKTDVSAGGTIAGTGVSFGRGTSSVIHVGEITIEVLMSYMKQLVDRVKQSGYKGAILHLNNLELIGRNDIGAISSFFDEIRDAIQIPDVYFIFVGNTGLFQEAIVPVERVRSVFFGQPITVTPMLLQEVIKVIEKRYELLSMQKGNWIAPIEIDLVEKLYDTFSGKIRSIMDTVTSLVASLPEGVTGTISTQEARDYLKLLASQKIKHLLTDMERNVLMQAIRQKRFTNSSLAKATNKSKQNINKYVARFRRLNLISQLEKIGKNVYYEVAPELRLLE